MSEGIVEGVTLKSKHKHFLLILSVFISVCTIGHEICLFIIHYQVVQDLDSAPSLNKVIPHAVPTFLPIVTFPCCLVVMFCCMFAFCTTEGMSGLIVGAHTFISIMLTLTYPLQIIVYLYAHVHRYLALWEQSGPIYKDPHCFCSPASSSVLTGFRCDCPSTNEDSKIFFFERDPNETTTWYEMVKSLDPALEESRMIYTNVSSVERNRDAIDFGSMKTMFIGLQASILIMVIRMPLFMLWNDIEFTQESDEAHEKLRRRMRGKRTSVVEVDTETPHEPPAHDQQQVEEDSDDTCKMKPIQRKLQLRFMINLAFYGFLEGADAFSLIQLFERFPYFYSSHLPVANVVLVIISINLIAVNFANLIVVIPRKPKNHRRLWRLTLTLVGNLPLLILRLCVLAIHGGFATLCFGCIFMLFVIKEMTFVALAFGEFVLDECVSRVVKKRMAKHSAAQQCGQQEGPVPHSFLGTHFSGAFSLGLSTSAAKYMIEADKNKKRRRSRGGGKETAVRRVSIVNDALTPNGDDSSLATTPRSGSNPDISTDKM